MPILLNILLRFFLFTAGVLLAASLAVAGVLMIAAWAVRAGWARLTGKPIAPFIFRIDPRTGFGHMYSRRGQGHRAPEAQGRRPGRHQAADVTDVAVKEPRS
jgi:hypothetical protein